ncbi:MAG: PAS domain-containing protein [Acidobacteriota bacterium]|nr:PAS domain-containing protein [Acidobacteriota bacterium]
MRVNYYSEDSNSSGDVYLLSHHHTEVDGSEFVVFTDPSRRYVDCTDGVCRLLGYDRSELLARTIDNVSFDAAQVCQLFADYLQRGRMDGEYVLRHKSGTPVPIRYRAFVFPDGCTAAVWEPIKNWRELYLSALVEIDPAILKRKLEIALHAVERRTQELKNSAAAPPSEQQSLRDAASALKSLMRTS